MCNNTTTTWTEHRLQQLRDLWVQGLSTAEIGVRLGVSKNAIVGKAHRLDLPGRPSPIRQKTPQSPRPPRLKRATPQPDIPRLAELVTLLISDQADTPTAAVPHVRDRALSTRKSTCCWPIGDPGTPTFRFCGDLAERGKPYCAEHASLAYVATAAPERRSSY